MFVCTRVGPSNDQIRHASSSSRRHQVIHDDIEQMGAINHDLMFTLFTTAALVTRTHCSASVLKTGTENKSLLQHSTIDRQLPYRPAD